MAVERVELRNNVTKRKEIDLLLHAHASSKFTFHLERLELLLRHVRLCLSIFSSILRFNILVYVGFIDLISVYAKLLKSSSIIGHIE